MTLYELISKLTNVPIMVLHNDSDNNYKMIYRGDSRFFRATDDEWCMLVHHIAPHKENIGEIFIMVKD